ncbi:isoamylase [Treponema pectinovorum]|uniref:isoamylase n=1 Tax=Treponema pectinovorum TaxID=164 RepID=UPI003D89C0FF
MKSIFIASIFFAFLLTPVLAKNVAEKKDTYDYDSIVRSINDVTQPLVIDGYAVFTAENNARNVGIAFDFENYSKIHSYKLRKIYDYEGKETRSWYFFILELPKKIESLSYKLIIDGLWTADPTNKNTIYDSQNGIQLSYLELPKIDEMITQTVNEGFTKFVCKSSSGQRIRLAGTFTNWDSWIYEMQEVQPGTYEITLPLPSGTYYYAYYTGLTRFIDETNPEKAYTKDGNIASKITVN